ncbi:hypothetical protein LTS18_003389 [Coniosporium uncinatum]|uniref:Uncharacterized protein n=1 Tax=Coniosporium uncinatum TaxID=93489 RepID=A0ACC3DZ29_9PEZI|nr:hypothetical protein LTS18_003389 [Coniosporium uncinatum]
MNTTHQTSNTPDISSADRKHYNHDIYPYQVPTKPPTPLTMATPYFSAPVANPAHFQKQLELEESLIRPHLTLFGPASSSRTSSECHICTSSYDSGLDGAEANHVRAVIKTCGHSFGSSCLGMWFESGVKNFYEDDVAVDKVFRCPMCRRDVFGENKVAVAGMYHVLARWRSAVVKMGVEEAVRGSMEMAEGLFGEREGEEEFGLDERQEDVELRIDDELEGTMEDEEVSGGRRRAPSSRDWVRNMPRGVEGAFTAYLSQLRQRSPTTTHDEGGIEVDDDGRLVESESTFNQLRSIVSQIFECDPPSGFSMAEFNDAYNFIENISNAALRWILKRFAERETARDEAEAIVGMFASSERPGRPRRVDSPDGDAENVNEHPNSEGAVNDEPAVHDAVGADHSATSGDEDSDEISERGSVDPWALDYESESEAGDVSDDENELSKEFPSTDGHRLVVADFLNNILEAIDGPHRPDTRSREGSGAEEEGSADDREGISHSEPSSGQHPSDERSSDRGEDHFCWDQEHPPAESSGQGGETGAGGSPDDDGDDDDDEKKRRNSSSEALSKTPEVCHLGSERPGFCDPQDEAVDGLIKPHWLDGLIQHEDHSGYTDISDHIHRHSCRCCPGSVPLYRGELVEPVQRFGQSWEVGFDEALTYIQEYEDHEEVRAWWTCLPNVERARPGVYTYPIRPVEATVLQADYKEACYEHDDFLPDGLPDFGSSNHPVLAKPMLTTTNLPAPVYLLSRLSPFARNFQPATHQLSQYQHPLPLRALNGRAVREPGYRAIHQRQDLDILEAFITAVGGRRGPNNPYDALEAGEVWTEELCGVPIYALANAEANGIADSLLDGATSAGRNLRTRRQRPLISWRGIMLP